MLPIFQLYINSTFYVNVSSYKFDDQLIFIKGLPQIKKKKCQKKKFDSQSLFLENQIFVKKI